MISMMRCPNLVVRFHNRQFIHILLRKFSRPLFVNSIRESMLENFLNYRLKIILKNLPALSSTRFYHFLNAHLLNIRGPKVEKTRKGVETEDNNDQTSTSDSENNGISAIIFFRIKKKFAEKWRKICAMIVCLTSFIFVIWESFGRKLGQPESKIVPEINWQQFVSQFLSKGEVQKIFVFPDQNIASIVLHPDSIIDGKLTPTLFYSMRIDNLNKFEENLRAAEAELGISPQDSIPVYFRRPSPFIRLMLLTCAAFVVYRLIKKGKFKIGFTPQDMMSAMGKANFTIINPNIETKSAMKLISFKDVAGLHEAKVEIREFVGYLKSPAYYTNLGAKLPKGALLLGPPGCGKTLLAKALATESSVPFIVINGTDFVEMIGGLGASRIRSLFATAKKQAPCIIYMDEIDAIGRKRSGNEMSGNFGGSGEEEQTLNQLLVEMDGMDSQQGVIVIASTNRADILDRALLRPGRFDRHILIDHPTVLERKELFELYLSKIKLDQKPYVYSHKFAQMTVNFTGADIHNVVNEAAIRAGTKEKNIVTIKELDHAMQRVLAGPEKRSQTLTQDEKEIVAYHESGHALIGWLLEHTDALLKVSIVPRTTSALGFSQYSPSDRKLYSIEQLYDRMCMCLGGRAAENVIFGRITTGAESDLKKVTKMADKIVKKYGMNTVIGPLAFTSMSDEDERSEMFINKPYSKHFGNLMDQEVMKLVAEVYFHTEDIIKENKDKLITLASNLLSRNVLSYEDVKSLIGPPKFGEKQVIELSDQLLPNLDEQDSHLDIRNRID